MAGDGDEESVNSATIETLVKDVQNEEEVVMRIHHSGEDFDVTRKAKKSMELAMDAAANQPNYYFKCQFAVEAVCDILNLERNEYSFRTDDEDSNANFDWKSAFPGHPDTYPKSLEPSKDEYKLVKTACENVKEEKDAEAIKRGFPSSGIQSYITFQQKWRSWRQWSAVFKAMNPDMADDTVYDAMTAELKLLSSNKTITQKINEAVKKQRAKILKQERLANKETANENEIIDLTEQVEQSKEALKKIEAKEEQLKQAKTSAKNGHTRIGTGKTEAIKKVIMDQKKIRKEKGDVKKTIKNLDKQVEVQKKRKQYVEKAKAAPAVKKKRTPRNDLDLVNASVTPRQLFAKDGALWKPPTLIQMEGALSFEQPGEKWEDASVRKAKLLFALNRCLCEAGEVEATPTLRFVMETFGVDEMEQNFDFHARAFIQLVVLTIFEHL